MEFNAVQESAISVLSQERQEQDQAKIHMDKLPWRIPVTDNQFPFLLVILDMNMHSAYVPYIHIYLKWVLSILQAMRNLKKCPAQHFSFLYVPAKA